jgi:hypothetical protein
MDARLDQSSAVDIKMSRNDLISPEEIWDAILSRDIARIIKTWHKLNQDEQLSLTAHLERMVNEDGWHTEQVTSAQSALDTIHGNNLKDRNDPQ